MIVVIRHSYKNRLQTRVTNPHGTYGVLNDNDKQKICLLHNDGLLDRDIAKEIRCSRELVSRKIREAGLR